MMYLSLSYALVKTEASDEITAPALSSTWIGKSPDYKQAIQD